MTPPTATTTIISQRNQEDLLLSKILHGNWDESVHQSSFISKLYQKGRVSQSSTVNDYLDNWKEENPENETEADRAQRASAYKAVANSFYDLATDFYEYAWGTSFHFCRFRPREPFQQAIARHEHYLAASMGVQSHHCVLDIGSGVGGPAREIGHFTGAYVTGLNNNDYQIARAKRYALNFGLDHKSDFVKGDFMNMPFDDNSFDACYAIEATVHASPLEGVYGEAYRVLKPGGVFGCYEWLLTENYDPTNPDHLRVVRGLEVGNGIAKMVTIEECHRALEAVGFNIEKAQNMGATDDEIEWYYPLEGDIRKANTFWDYLTVLRATTVGRAVTTYMVQALEAVGLAAPGSSKVSTVLQLGADSVLEGARMGIFTPMYLFVARKPNA
ncbi:Delta(24)-sterol C-methyltransferase [Lobosporangium transversale]|uniref:Sterol 24-C-methyltransferase n=1 Tax=Lobosporangium transversale TaxID=64571 RepID=A0A1Y2GXL5_9FUNG|nr:S-adenosyl-L-methionine-dependent methyltransferase [Lobosporangium transversale]KAF9914993.1 Delta(24)-sterol C-methyltransferase [Lobosporangium transversale]ORZ27030.1 S-adenosyl-L-methionine-dependent methyltransferase [Lobosporangium transversale]|eukprot:XP_021884777.1 S-adenosyl-L-methionine-dependent methyltransferase [Lobosporangium transversale]